MSIRKSIELNYKCHKAISAFLDQANAIKSQSDSITVLTVFEWQNFAPILFGYGQAILAKIISKIDTLIKERLDCIAIEYLDVDKIAIISSHADMKRHKKAIGEFFKGCLAFGANLPVPVYIGFKTGSARLKDDAQTTMNEALIALFEAKSSCMHQHVTFNDELYVIKDLHHQMELAAYLLEAIQNRRLRLAFQPIISAKTGKIENYEALLRILTEEGNIITAGPFIPAAEKLGFIKIIDSFVLKAVVDELKAHPKVRIAINISSMVVKDAHWYKEAKSLLKDSNIAKRLTLEITETSSEYDITSVAKFVENVKSLGCEVAIDDFGAGYTSFKQLKLISVDILKIDGVFIRDIIENPESKLFVNILLNFAKAYNLKTVAEFVETPEIAKILIELGVDYLQGFHFSQALNYRPWVKEDALRAKNKKFL